MVSVLPYNSTQCVSYLEEGVCFSLQARFHFHTGLESLASKARNAEAEQVQVMHAQLVGT